MCGGVAGSGRRRAMNHQTPPRYHIANTCRCRPLLSQLFDCFVQHSPTQSHTAAAAAVGEGKSSLRVLTSSFDCIASSVPSVIQWRHATNCLLYITRLELWQLDCHYRFLHLASKQTCNFHTCVVHLILLCCMLVKFKPKGWYY